MQTVTKIQAARKLLNKTREKGCSVAFVPAMGALHQGHRSLIKTAQERCDVTVVSIFVNPTQFTSSVDYDTYPRDLASDQQSAKDAGVDILFTPSAREIYPAGCIHEIRIQGDLCR